MMLLVEQTLMFQYVTFPDGHQMMNKFWKKDAWSCASYRKKMLRMPQLTAEHY